MENGKGWKLQTSATLPEKARMMVVWGLVFFLCFCFLFMLFLFSFFTPNSMSGASTHTHTHTHAFTHTYMHAHTHACMYVYTHACIGAHTCMHATPTIPLHTHTYKLYIHRHTHIQPERVRSLQVIISSQYYGNYSTGIYLFQFFKDLKHCIKWTRNVRSFKSEWESA